MPSIRLHRRRSCTRIAAPISGTGRASTSAQAPSAANTMLTVEIWFGETDERASADAMRRAHAVSRDARGLRSAALMRQSSLSSGERLIVLAAKARIHRDGAFGAKR